MQRPRKAILLAAGYGTRMGPLSRDLPKPLMPLWGKPLIAHVFDGLRDWGVRDVLVNLHHQPDEIFQYLRTRDHAGMRVTCSFEPEILGTGGALDRAAFFLDDSPFWIVNTDIAFDVSPLPFVREFQRHHPLAVLWLDPSRGPRTVESRNGRITNFSSSTPGAPGTTTFCGLHLASPDILKWIPTGRFYGIIEAYRKAMVSGRRVSGVVVPDSFWADMGSPEQYLDAHVATWNNHRRHRPGGRLFDPRQSERVRRLQAQGVVVQGVVSICDGATVEPGARICDSVIWPSATVGRRAVLNRAVVGRATAVNRVLSSGAAIRADRMLHDEDLRPALTRMGWRPEDTTLARLSARGSDRCFTRMIAGNRSAILVQYGTQRTDNSLYAGHARLLLRHGVPVPRVLVDLPALRTIVIEDAGDVSLQSLAAGIPPTRLERCYRATLDAALMIHRIPLRRIRHHSMEPAFSKDVYRWERELLANHLLRKRLGLPEKKVAGILKDLESVARQLLRAPCVLVHRDMQSSNVLWHKGKPVFIDFQSMRLGPAACDVASLLCDPYVMLEPDLQSSRREYYLSRSRCAAGVRDFFWLAAVERLAQALGAYGRLSVAPDTARFAGYIEPGLVMLSRALDHLEGLSCLRDLALCDSA